ncbi:MAG TPA: glycine/sarcosine/betaine reductase component B subunit [Acidimicrobiales bacterium]
MGLARLVHVVSSIELGNRLGLAEGVLTVPTDEAAGLFDSPALASVAFSVAAPGDSARIVKVLDAVEPRTKGVGGGGIFPGFVGPADGAAVGTGVTHLLRGAAVVVAGYLPRAQEAIIDMSGPAADLCPLAQTVNLVVEFEPADGAAWEDVDVALRVGALRLAARLAEAGLDVEPDVVEEPLDPEAGDGLPKVAALTNLQTQGTFKDVFVNGTSFAGEQPRVIDPGAIDDGAVVSGQYGHPSLKNPTWVHQNHPVAAALRARHGVDLCFAGVVISPEPVAMAAKEDISAAAAQVCADAGFDAVIVTKEGGGNADADMALKMDAIEELGMTAVGLFGEMSGIDGTGPPIVVPPERATAMVSTGNYDHRLTLPAVERAYGGERVALVDQPATEEMELPTAVIYCALSCLGWGRLRALV